jgi:hypothetical protein
MLSEPIFVGGHSRTGTTLMQGLICNQPLAISVTREASYFRALIEAYELGLRWFDLHTCDYFESRQELTNFHRSLIQPYLDRVLSRFGNRDDAIIVQKEPRMTEFFPEVGTLLPRSKFVVLIRDLRDVIASQIVRCKKNKIAYQPDQDLDRYVRTMRRLILDPKKLEGRLLFVRYEGLVNSPTQVMSQVWRFLEMDNLHVDNQTRWVTKRPPGDESATELDEQPPSSDPIGKNRHVLTSEILATVEQVRKYLLSHTRLDCYYSDTVTDHAQSVFYIKDIAKPG